MRANRIQDFFINAARFGCDWRPWLTKHETWRRLGARNVIALWNELKFGPPKTIVDVGARESEFTRWLVEEWPYTADVISFEPDIRVTPAFGQVRRIALSNENGVGHMEDNGGTVCPYLVPSDDQAGGVPVRRFDCLDGIEIKRPALLKVDAEVSTLKAIQGFGGRINEFDLVVAEASNNGSALLSLIQVMARDGFTKARLVDTGAKVGGLCENMDIAFWK